MRDREAVEDHIYNYDRERRTLNFPKNDIPSPPAYEPTKVLLAQKMQHKGALFGHISNGGGTINLGNGLSLSFVARDAQFVILQVFHHGIDARVETQTWQKAKVVVEKKPEPAKTEETVIKPKITSKSLL
jgi:hypothetical protein